MAMLSSGVLRVAVRTSQLGGSFSVNAGGTSLSSYCTAKFYGKSSSRLVQGRRYMSVYGYIQAKALVYSKYGEPKDVLQYVETSLYEYRLSITFNFLTLETVSISILSLLHMELM